METWWTRLSWVFSSRSYKELPHTSFPTFLSKLTSITPRLPVLALINVRSLKKTCSSNKKACTLLRDDIHKLNIDICAVTETFLRPSVPDSFITITGFNHYRRDRQACNCRRANCTQAHKGGGILNYVHSKITSEIFDTSATCEAERAAGACDEPGINVNS
jgi:hypothetical protein